jgi:hypothetical protein
MTNNRAPVVIPAAPPQPPDLSLINAALRPDKTSDPAISNSLSAITTEQLAALPDDLRLELEAREGEAWTRGITYAPENNWAATVRDACDGTSVEAPPLAAPRNLAVTEEAGKGTVKAEALEYQVTATNANGETTANAAVKITLAAEGAALLKWKKDGDSEGTKYRVYGRVAGKLLLLTEVGPFDKDQKAEWLDTGTATEKAGKKPPVSNTTGGPGKYTNLPIVTAIPFLIKVEDYCSTFGFQERDFKGRAERLLQSAEPKAIENEFWTGALAKAKGYPNNYLTKKKVTTAGEEFTPENLTPEAGAPSILRGLQILQDALAECGFGGRGMIHLQRQTATNLLTVVESDPHFRSEEDRMYDLFGNIIVPGVGYNGAEGFEGKAAGAGKAWMCATDLVSVRSEEKPTVVPETFAEMTDWGQAGEPNTVRTPAQKFAVAYADFGCGPFWVEVTLAT